MKAQSFFLIFFIGILGGLTACSGSSEPSGSSVEPGRILFQTNRDGNSEIYVMNPDGTGLRNLTQHDSLDYHPTASLDGTRIAFISARSGSRQIWLMDADGLNPRQVTDTPGANIDPSFSTDGAWIAYDGTGEDDNTEIYVIPVEGGTPVNISNNQAIDSHPFWSPVDDQIAFYSNRDNPESDSMEVYVMNADGSEVRRLTYHPADDRYPSWSPDGKQIAFSTTRDGDAEIYIMDALDGSELMRITHSPENDLAPAWSPDGSMLAFVSARLGAFEVFLIHVDGTGETNLSNNEASDSNPRWLPDRQ